MQSRLRAQAIFGVLVLAHGFGSTVLLTSALAQAPKQLDQVSQSALVERVAQTGPKDLTPTEIVRLYKWQPRINSSAELDVWDSMFEQLVWMWAAERGLDADAAIGQLARAYEKEFGRLDASLMGQLRKQLDDLPSPDIGLYRAPSYIPKDLAQRIRRPAFIGRPPFGPIEKNGISRLSIGIRRRH
jgi:hypothetical protein